MLIIIIITKFTIAEAQLMVLITFTIAGTLLMVAIKSTVAVMQLVVVINIQTQLMMNPAGVSGFFIDIKSFRSHYGTGVKSASRKNEYQEYFLGVNAAGA